MDSNELQPIFKHLDEMKAELKADIKDVKEDVRLLSVAVDNLTKMIKGFEEEMIVNRKRIDVLEKWARQVSEKFGIPLPF